MSIPVQKQLRVFLSTLLPKTGKPTSLAYVHVIEIACLTSNRQFMHFAEFVCLGLVDPTQHHVARPVG